MSEKTKRKLGRPTKAPEGKRITFHISLSPRGLETLNRLCDRPITPIEKSALIEHLILKESEKQQ